ERIFISWELGCEKPDGAIFQQVEEALNLPSSALLHVGDDRQRDWEGARNAGWRAILVNAEDGPEDRIPDLAEVLALVSNTSR
ncbi:MAG: HAD-IA family hydrolase, partial [Opitutales bacterium]